MAAGAFALSVLGGGPAEARSRHAAHHGAGDPVVVELFTAQGCATCPKANGVIGELQAKKSVLPLTFSVDYWDYLGWPDTLAKPEFAARQRAYVQRLKVREIYTPEIVVGGRSEGPALEHKTIDGLIAAAEAQRPRHLRLRFSHHGGRVKVTGPSEGLHGDVWLIRYAPGPQSVKIKAGENKGQTVLVSNAVRELTRLGPLRGAGGNYRIDPPADAGLKTAVIVQAVRGGPILASARE